MLAVSTFPESRVVPPLQPTLQMISAKSAKKYFTNIIQPRNKYETNINQIFPSRVATNLPNDFCKECKEIFLYSKSMFNFFHSHPVTSDVFSFHPIYPPSTVSTEVVCCNLNHRTLTASALQFNAAVFLNQKKY